MINSEKQLQALIEAVSSSTKYRQVSPDLIRAVGQRELSIRPSWKAAVKATKNKLHQVAGAYQGTKIDYGQALTMLRETAASPAEFRESCRQIMRWHVSTRERLPILGDFFAETLLNVSPVRTVMDVACGLNPVAWPWMPFDDQVNYIAYDIYADTMRFVQDYMQVARINGRAQTRDVLQDPPNQPVDLAFILKTLPCLEQLDKMAATILLDAIQARYLLISYPVTSLGGRRKGMITNYDNHFRSLATDRSWSVKRFEFATELAYLVETGDEKVNNNIAQLDSLPSRNSGSRDG
ncbi:MAG: 16S rRNA methyltransferase [Chloroflexi bacterium]|jgi:16S rRNA (guanine(1405)-N(7))-methyltransferase|nr:16S rRNA methyltransferase [Chloroflexota bacterium]